MIVLDHDHVHVLFVHADYLDVRMIQLQRFLINFHKITSCSYTIKRITLIMADHLPESSVVGESISILITQTDILCSITLMFRKKFYTDFVFALFG